MCGKKRIPDCICQCLKVYIQKYVSWKSVISLTRREGLHFAWFWQDEPLTFISYTIYWAIEILHCITCHANYNTTSSSSIILEQRKQMEIKISEVLHWSEYKRFTNTERRLFVHFLGGEDCLFSFSHIRSLWQSQSVRCLEHWAGSTGPRQHLEPLALAGNLLPTKLSKKF